MPPIETVIRPIRNRISIQVPKEYAAYSFRITLVPLAPEKPAIRTVGKVPGLSFKIKDEDLFSDDAEMWEICSNDVTVA